MLQSIGSRVAREPHERVENDVCGFTRHHRLIRFASGGERASQLCNSHGEKKINKLKHQISMLRSISSRLAREPHERVSRVENDSCGFHRQPSPDVLFSAEVGRVSCPHPSPAGFYQSHFCTTCTTDEVRLGTSQFSTFCVLHFVHV